MLWVNLKIIRKGKKKETETHLSNDFKQLAIVLAAGWFFKKGLKRDSGVVIGG